MSVFVCLSLSLSVQLYTGKCILRSQNLSPPHPLPLFFPFVVVVCFHLIVLDLLLFVFLLVFMSLLFVFVWVFWLFCGFFVCLLVLFCLPVVFVFVVLACVRACVRACVCVRERALCLAVLLLT